MAPIEIRWLTPAGESFCLAGESLDASIYGLGVIVPASIPPDTEVTVLVHGKFVCGTATVRYSHPLPAGFKIGLQFGLTLVMQDIPGIDALLMRSLRLATERPASTQRLSLE